MFSSQVRSQQAKPKKEPPTKPDGQAPEAPPPPKKPGKVRLS